MQLGTVRYDYHPLGRLITDTDNSGFTAIISNGAIAADRLIMITRAQLTWAQLQLRTDLLALEGAEINVVDWPATVGSQWKVVRDPAFSADTTGLAGSMLLVPISDIQVNSAAPLSAVANISEQGLYQFSLPPGLLNTRRKIRFYYGIEKASTVDTLTFRIRMGVLGTFGDAILLTNTEVATTTRSTGRTVEFCRADSTHLRQLGGYNGSGSYNGGSTVGGTVSSAVGNLDNTTNFITVTTQMTTGAEVAQVDNFQMTLIAG